MSFKSKIFEERKRFRDEKTSLWIKKFMGDLKVEKVQHDVPEPLKRIFRGETFLKPKFLPGVYVFYFPINKKVYIGEAAHICNEIHNHLNLRTGSITLGNYIGQNRRNLKTYAIFQGRMFCKEKRLAFEKKLIEKAGENAVNISGKAKSRKRNLQPFSTVVKPVFSLLDVKESWLDYGLPYEKVELKKGQFGLYAILKYKKVIYRRNNGTSFKKKKV